MKSCSITLDSPEKSIFPVLVFVDVFNVIFDNCHTSSAHSSASKHSNCLQHTLEQGKKRANSRSLAVLQGCARGDFTFPLSPGGLILEPGSLLNSWVSVGCEHKA